MEKIGKLSYDRSKPLGSAGRFGKVFSGKYKNAINVAAKRFDKDRTQLASNLYLRANGHHNIIQYYSTKDKDFENM